MTASHSFLGLGLGLLVWTTPARAENQARLAYSAPASCPAEADFKQAVADRGGHFESGEARPAERELRVSIAESSGAFTGSLQATQAGVASAVREVHGATCQEVINALAVVSALELRGENPAPAPKLVVAPSVPSATAARDQPVPDDGRLQGSSSNSVHKQVEVNAGTLRFDTSRSISLSAGGELGLLPSQVVPRYDFLFSSASFVTPPGGKNYLTGVIPRLRLSFLGPATYRSGDATARLEQISFGMGLCWSPHYDTRGLVALFCVEYAGGLSNVKTKERTINFERTKSSGLGEGAIDMELDYNLGSLFHLGFELGASAMTQAVTAERADNSQIFSSAPFQGYAMLGLGLHF